MYTSPGLLYEGRSLRTDQASFENTSKLVGAFSHHLSYVCMKVASQLLVRNQGDPSKRPVHLSLRGRKRHKLRQVHARPPVPCLRRVFPYCVMRHLRSCWEEATQR